MFSLCYVNWKWLPGASLLYRQPTHIQSSANENILSIIYCHGAK